MTRSDYRGMGFTLIETLVAFSILVLALGALWVIFSDSLHRSGNDVAQTRSIAVAQALLARVGADLPLIDGELDGLQDGLHWHLTISPYGSDEDRANWLIEAHEVLVRVSWGPGDRQHSFDLHTLRIGRAS